MMAMCGLCGGYREDRHPICQECFKLYSNETVNAVVKGQKVVSLPQWIINKATPLRESFGAAKNAVVKVLKELQRTNNEAIDLETERILTDRIGDQQIPKPVLDRARAALRSEVAEKLQRETHEKIREKENELDGLNKRITPVRTLIGDMEKKLKNGTLPTVAD